MNERKCGSNRSAGEGTSSSATNIEGTRTTGWHHSTVAIPSAPKHPKSQKLNELEFCVTLPTTVEAAVDQQCSCFFAVMANT